MSENPLEEFRRAVAEVFEIPVEDVEVQVHDGPCPCRETDDGKP